MPGNADVHACDGQGDSCCLADARIRARHNGCAWLGVAAIEVTLASASRLLSSKAQLAQNGHSLSSKGAQSEKRMLARSL